jgi:transglutaminase-like putative cysteine protease
MIYSVRHITKFSYRPAIRESVMEVRMHPRSEANQRCLTFELNVKPSATLMQYRDFLGNIVLHFDIAGGHTQLTLEAQSTVEVLPIHEPDIADAGTWENLDAMVAADGYYEMILPSAFARPTALLEELAREMELERRGTPLRMLFEISEGIHEKFSYVPNTTTVDSPIDHALSERKGVCQDFAHIMIALVRKLGVPCRYVSGYLFHAKEDQSLASEGASHAWVEARLPGLGWVGFDPTNNLLCGERHIRVAVGRDYAEVPPTRGVFKGGAESELSVSVTVALANAPAPEDLAPATILRRIPPPIQEETFRAQQEQQQQWKMRPC